MVEQATAMKEEQEQKEMEEGVVPLDTTLDAISQRLESLLEGLDTLDTKVEQALNHLEALENSMEELTNQLEEAVFRAEYPGLEES